MGIGLWNLGQMEKHYHPSLPKHQKDTLYPFFFLAAPWHMESLGQGSGPSHSLHLDQSSGSASSLTQCPRSEIEPATQCPQDATDPVALEQELLS